MLQRWCHLMCVLLVLHVLVTAFDKTDCEYLECLNEEISSCVGMWKGIDTNCHEILEVYQFRWTIPRIASLDIAAQKGPISQSIHLTDSPRNSNSDAKYHLRFATYFSKYYHVELGYKKGSRPFEFFSAKAYLLETNFDRTGNYQYPFNSDWSFYCVMGRHGDYQGYSVLSFNWDKKPLNEPFDVFIELFRLRKIPECLVKDEKDVSRGNIVIQEYPNVTATHCTTEFKKHVKLPGTIFDKNNTYCKSEKCDTMEPSYAFELGKYKNIVKKYDTPGLDYFPKPSKINGDSDLIWIQQGQNGNYKNYMLNIDGLIKEYFEDIPNVIDCEDGRVVPEDDEVCQFAPYQFRMCTTRQTYGYFQGKPCVFMKINRLYNWKPDVYKNTELPEEVSADVKTEALEDPSPMVYIDCKGVNPEDKLNLGPVKYYPTPGFPAYYFPYLNKKGYLHPLVAVQFMSPRRDTLINVECNLWAKNIKRDVQNRIGATRFSLMVDDEVKQ